MSNIPERKKIYQDCIFLSSIVFLSMIPYMTRLGFYGFDWSNLANLSISGDQSLPVLFKILYNDYVKTQPGKILYFVLLYRLFGLNPVGYHFFNAMVFLVNIVFFYLVLRLLNQRRLLSLSVALVYALLPHYSTVRFWMQGFVPNLSMTFYFLSLYSDLRAMGAPGRALWGWKLISILSIIASILTYDIFIPFFLLNPILVWYRERQMLEEQFDWSPERSQFSFTRLLRTNLIVQFCVLVPIIIFKMLTTIHLENSTIFSLIKKTIKIIMQTFDAGHGSYDWGLNYVHALIVAFFEYGLGLPFIVWNIVRNYPNMTNFIMAGLLVLLIFVYLSRVINQSNYGHPSQNRLLKFIYRGLVVFGLGYSIFLTNWGVQYTATGSANLTAIAAALGVALTLVGVLGWISSLFHSEQLKRQIYCLLLTWLCATGFLINGTIALFWVAAHQQEQYILDDISKKLPTLPSGSTLIIDGFCPYIGPAVLFESKWDLTAALMIFYRDYTLRADIVSSRIEIKDDGVYIPYYGGVHEYSFKNLFIYNFEQKVGYQLTDAQNARHYFQTFNPNHNLTCPEGQPGFGLPIFKFASYILK
jgi:hypothetical protein